MHRESHGYTDADLAEIARVDARLLAELFPENFVARPILRAVTPTGVASQVS